MEEEFSSDEEQISIEHESTIQDLNTFYENYEELKKSYIRMK